MIWVGFGKKDATRRLLVAFLAGEWVQVAAPGLFWQHYYLLPLPGVAACVGIALSDAYSTARAAISDRKILRAASSTAAVVILSASILGTAEILQRDYLMVAPERLTIDYKGGAQWVALREIGRQIRHRTESWKDPRLFVWGIQSPLYIYSRMPGVTRQVFADPLIVAYMDRDHRLIRPRLERTLAELESTRPDLILLGERPFPGLLAFVRRNYLPAPVLLHGRDATMGRLWVRRDRSSAFQGP